MYNTASGVIFVWCSAEDKRTHAGLCRKKDVHVEFVSGG